MPENPIELCNYGNRGEAFVPYKEHLKPPMAELDGSSVSNSQNKNNCRGSFDSCFLTDQVKLPSKLQNPISQHQQSLRKQRRSWSPELHRRFIDALQKLGGFQG